MEQEILINQYKDAFLAKYFFVTYKEPESAGTHPEETEGWSFGIIISKCMDVILSSEYRNQSIGMVNLILVIMRKETHPISGEEHGRHGTPSHSQGMPLPLVRVFGTVVHKGGNHCRHQVVCICTVDWRKTFKQRSSKARGTLWTLAVPWRDGLRAGMIELGASREGAGRGSKRLTPSHWCPDIPREWGREMSKRFYNKGPFWMKKMALFYSSSMS